jgi:hypothetical protein
MDRPRRHRCPAEAISSDDRGKARRAGAGFAWRRRGDPGSASDAASGSCGGHRAATERDLALCAVAIEAAATVADELTGALNAAFTVEVRLLGLRDALGARSDHGGGIEKVNNMIRTAKAAASVPRDPESGRRLLETLARDPAAVL